MRLVILAALIAAAPAVAADHPKLAAKPICQNAGVTQVEGHHPKAGIHPLNQEPPAKEVLTVLRAIDGCTRPVVIRRDIGAPAASAAKRG